MKILVVDDSIGAASTFKLYAEALGHEVRMARDAVEALAVMREGFHPDAWLVDIHLRAAPDGSSFIRQMSSLPGRFVAWTAYRGEDLDLPDGTPVIYKPAEPQELMAALEKAAAKEATT